MTLVVPNVGEVVALNAITGKTAATTLTLRLFSNNHTVLRAESRAVTPRFEKRRLSIQELIP